MMARDRLEERVGERRDAMGQLDAAAAGQKRFVEWIRSGAGNSIVCYDAQGRAEYPDGAPPQSRPLARRDGRWEQAEQLEFVDHKLSEAADRYGLIAREASDADETAAALLAQARCLVGADDRAGAIEILGHRLSEPRFADARDARGRLIAPDALMRAVEVFEDRSSPACLAVIRHLASVLNDYDSRGLSSAQQRFLMQRLESLAPDAVDFPTLEAEQLAADFVAQDLKPAGGSQLALAGLPDIWRLASLDRRHVALFRTRTLRTMFQDAFGGDFNASGVTFDLLPPDEAVSSDRVALIPAGTNLPGWRLAASLEDQAGFDSAARVQTATYLWTAILVIVATTVMAVLVGMSFRRQMRLARLKNDLVATVSHELKTPLASMRVLVDTLLDEKEHDDGKTREYLELIAKENLRLSRLIDNFLTFSRMERNRRAFEPRPTDVGGIVDEVVDSVGERFDTHGCQFDVRVEEGLPPILADFDAVVTAVLNLLDNAYKYTGESKDIVLLVRADGGTVCFEVTDNGIGMSKAATRRVFKRFYQVDRRLSREVGGCGLGLSIVKFVADEHGGSIRVSSRPGKGSTFMLAIPAAERPRSGSSARSSQERQAFGERNPE
jgi:signal transduction histidine kinase